MYVLPFSGGLIAANFMVVINRFGLILEYVIQTFNEDRLIDFGAPTPMPMTADYGTGAMGGELPH
ncbi:hypothetical protein MAFF241647_14890 [Ralstonia solanacearum]|nr:hypothetical protein MAFF241647_14890 [Ralstonia solanacearum]